MRIRAALALIFALLVAMLVVPAPAAVAVPVWTPPRVFEPTVVGPGVAGNAAGQSVAVWLENPRTSSIRLVASFRDHRGSWSTPRLISERDRAVAVYYAPQVTMSETGSIIVSWTELHKGPNDGGDPLLDFAVRGGPGGWEEPRRTSVGAVTRHHRDTTGNVLLAGDATLGCVPLDAFPDFCPPEEYAEGRAYLRTQALPVKGAWTDSVTGPEGRYPDAVVDDDGSADFVWFRTVGRDGPEGDVVAATRSAAGEWGTPSVLASVDDLAGGPRLVRDPQGNLTAVWSACDGGACRLVAARRPPSGEWSAPVTLDESDPAAPATSLEIVADDLGRVTVVWWDRATRHIETTRRAPDGTWEQTTRLSSDAGLAGPPSMDVDGAGNVVVGWSEHSGAAATFNTRSRAPRHEWEQVQVVHSRREPSPNRVSNWYDITALADSFAAFFHGAENTLFSERVDDVSAPVARVRPLGAVLRAGAARVAWSVRDGEAGVSSVVVRRRTAEFDGGLGAWSVWRRSSGSGSAAVRAVPGRTQCFSVRATDRVGNASRWSRQRCVSAPVDDRRASASGWRRVRSGQAFRDTQSVASRAGAQLVLPRVQGRSVRLLASTCRSCGRVEVRLGGARLGVVSLRSPRVRHQRVVRVAEFAKVRRGRLVVRVVSSGKPVRIDGFVIGR